MAKAESSTGPDFKDSHVEVLNSFKVALNNSDTPVVSVGEINEKSVHSRKTVNDRMKEIVDQYPAVSDGTTAGSTVYWMDDPTQSTEEILSSHYTELATTATRWAALFGWVFGILAVITGFYYVLSAPNLLRTVLVSLSVFTLVLFLTTAAFSWRYGWYMKAKFNEMSE